MAVADQVAAREFITLSGIECELTEAGERFFDVLGLDLPALRRRKRSFLQPCIYCTERKPHLAGALAAALLDQITEEGWVVPGLQLRTLSVTPKGQRRFKETFGIAPRELKI